MRKIKPYSHILDIYKLNLSNLKSDKFDFHHKQPSYTCHKCLDTGFIEGIFLETSLDYKNGIPTTNLNTAMFVCECVKGSSRNEYLRMNIKNLFEFYPELKKIGFVKNVWNESIRDVLFEQETSKLDSKGKNDIEQRIKKYLKNKEIESQKNKILENSILKNEKQENYISEDYDDEYSSF